MPEKISNIAGLTEELYTPLVEWYNSMIDAFNQKAITCSDLGAFTNWLNRCMSAKVAAVQLGGDPRAQLGYITFEPLPN